MYLDYPDLVYLEPRLSGHGQVLHIHWYACAEGVAKDYLGVW